MNFSKEERIDMIYVLGEAQKNCLLACRLYQMKYPDRRQPNTTAFKNVMNAFDNTGNVEYTKRVVKSRRIAEDKQLDVLLHVHDDPHLSSRQICHLTDISQSSVNRITRKNKYHPYHIQLHQELEEQDFQRRIVFCNTVNQKITENPNFLFNVMFSDEATFHNNGFVNKHNMHYYAMQNPHWVREINIQNRWSLNVWCGILGNKIIGPYFFERSLTGSLYLEFLRTQLPNLLEDIGECVRNNMWLQQDGAPAHYHNEVRLYLNQVYPEKWIGRGGFIPWPPRSCDLTPLDFYFWGYVKEAVYRECPTTLENMKDRIRNVCRNISADVLTNVRSEIQRRLNICLREDGRIFEHLL